MGFWKICQVLPEYFDSRAMDNLSKSLWYVYRYVYFWWTLGERPLHRGFEKTAFSFVPFYTKQYFFIFVPWLLRSGFMLIFQNLANISQGNWFVLCMTLWRIGKNNYTKLALFQYKDSQWDKGENKMYGKKTRQLKMKVSRSLDFSKVFQQDAVFLIFWITQWQMCPFKHYGLPVESHLCPFWGFWIHTWLMIT